MADPTKLVIISINGGVTPTQCVPFELVVEQQDDDGNPVVATGVSSVWSLGYGAFGAVFFINPLTITVGNSQATVTVTPKIACVDQLGGYHSFTFGFNGHPDQLLTVNAAAVTDHLSISTISTQTAGTSFYVTVTRQDSGSSPTKGDPLDVTIALLTGSGSLVGTVTGTIAQCETSVMIGPMTYCAAEAGVSVQATADGGLSGDSNTFTVAVGALDHFSWDTISSPQVAGVAFSATIRAKDVCENTIPSFTGTVALTGTSTPSTTGVFTAGVWTGNITVTIAGSRTVTATGSGASGTSNSFTVNPAAPDYLLWINPPLDLFCDQQRTLTCRVYDEFDNLCTNDDATEVTYSAISPQPTVTHTVSAGVTTFLLVVPSCGDCETGLSALIEATASGLTGDSFTLNYGFRPCGVLVDCASEKVLVDCASEKVLVAPCPKGACCIGGSCSQLTQIECEDNGGRYLGDGTTCHEFSCCPVPFPDFTLDFRWGGTLSDCTSAACMGALFGQGFTMSSVASALGDWLEVSPVSGCSEASGGGTPLPFLPTGATNWTRYSDASCVTWLGNSSVNKKTFYGLSLNCTDGRQYLILIVFAIADDNSTTGAFPLLFSSRVDVTDGAWPYRMNNGGCDSSYDIGLCGPDTVSVASGGYFDVDVTTP